MRNVIFFTLFLLYLTSCFEVPTQTRTNPNDEKNEEYIPPEVSFTTAPAENAVIEVDEVTFEWIGNDLCEEYCYKLNDDIWSDWSSENSVTFSYLDDMTHHCFVKARKVSGDIRESQIIQRNFSVDAINQPAVYFFPKCMKVSENENFEIEINFNEVTDLSVFGLILEFDSGLTLNSIEIIDEFLLGNGGDLIPFTEIDNNEGIAKINIGIVGAEPATISGSGTIAKLNFSNTDSNEKVISFDENSSFWDGNNNKIQISTNCKNRIKLK